MIRFFYRKMRGCAKRLGRAMKKKVPVYIPVLHSDLLQGRAAFITGGTRGIGFEIAKAFLASGAKVVITGRSQEGVTKAVAHLSEAEGCRGKVFGIALDNANCDALEGGFMQAVGFCDKIDILVNNAGIMKGGGFGNVSAQDFGAVLDVNLTGAYMMSQIAAVYMKENKIEGNILNICSTSSRRPAVSPYTISKWGLKGLTVGLAKVLIPYGIVVNGLAPGPVNTELLVHDGYDGLELAVNPNGRFATAAEIANLAVVLTSSLGRLVVGDILYAGGGAAVTTLDDMGYGF